MNVNMISGADRVGGIPRYSHNLTSALAPSGANIRHHRMWAGEWNIGGRPVGGLITRRAGAMVPVFAAGRETIAHATDHWAAQRAHPLHTVTIHDTIWADHPELYSTSDPMNRQSTRSLRRALHRAEHIVTPSGTVRRQLIDSYGVSSDRISVTPLGIDNQMFHPEVVDGASDRNDEWLDVLVVMDTNPRKQVKLILEAAQGLPVRITHVGTRRAHFPQVLSEEERLIKQLAPSQYLRREYVSDDELRTLYNRADVVAHPSVAEGFSIPPLEALACGAQVIASDIPTHREVLGTHARMVPLVAEAWREALQDAVPRREVAHKARAERVHYAHTFTWEKTARATLAVYGRILGVSAMPKTSIYGAPSVAPA